MAAVRTYSLISSIIKALFSKKARKKLNNMENQNYQKDKVCKLFNLVKNRDNKIYICIGSMVTSSKRFDSFEQANNYIGMMPYELIFNSCSLIAQQIYDKNEEIKKEIKKTAKNTKRNTKISNNDTEKLENNEK